MAVYTIPGPGEPGNETWAGDSWQTGGASVWVTGAYDPEQNLLFYGIGNPGPDYYGDLRLGDNLYSASIVALDATTGELAWHYQFTPHDVHDWDATEVPILADLEIDGRERQVVMFANRNGFYYTLDRTTGEVILARPFVMTTWATEIGADGRPYCFPATRPVKKAKSPVPTLPGNQLLATEFRPRNRGFLCQCARVVHDLLCLGTEYVRGERFTGGGGERIRDNPEMPLYGALRALDPTTGERLWEFQ